MTPYNGITFTVPGKPMAKARPRFAKVGNFIKTYTPTTTASFENMVKVMFMQTAGPEWTPLTGPVCLRVTAHFPRPKGHYGTGKNAEKLKESAPLHCTSKPDCDNLLKLIADALNGVAYEDDKQVVTATVAKVYHQTPHTRVEVCSMDVGGE